MRYIQLKTRVVLQIIDEVTGPHISFRPKVILFKIRIARQWRRFSFAKIGEHQPEIVLGRTTANPYLFRERFLFCRLLDALPRTGKFPAVKTTPDTILLHPTNGKL